jgi:predicted acyltransferase
MALTSSPVTAAGPPPRLVSLDAYRGFIMLAMASAGLGFGKVAKYFADNHSGEFRTDVWQFLAYQFDHVAWVGCSFWDLIQPSFMFMVGVALPYSFASRQAQGQSYGRMLAHTVYRAMILILLGIFLVSNSSKYTEFTFVNVLTQIGLGYVFVFLLVGKGFRVQLLASVAILVGYWLLFFLYPLPAAGFDYSSVGLKSDWQHLPGWFAHWDKNTNAAAAFDQWFLNLFPRAKPFQFSEGGYATLNFIPSMATMIFGLMAGELLRGRRTPEDKCRRLFLAGTVCLLVGLVLGYTVCPLVKRIWTPSWAVFSAGWTFWMLAAFYWIIDLKGYRGWAFPFVVVGMNSIAMYCMSQLLKPWIRQTWRTHFGQDLFSGIYGPIAESLAVLGVLWLVCLWMYRRKIFLRI